jgi:hypothetical protein
MLDDEGQFEEFKGYFYVFPVGFSTLLHGLVTKDYTR